MRSGCKAGELSAASSVELQARWFYLKKGPGEWKGLKLSLPSRSTGWYSPEIYRWGEASLLSSCKLPNLLLSPSPALCVGELLSAHLPPSGSCCRLGSKEHPSFPMQIHWWKHKMHCAAKTCWACLTKCQGLAARKFTIDLTTMILCALNTDGICSVFRMWALMWKKGIASNFLSLFGCTKADCWYYINSLDKINISLRISRVDV